MCVSSEDTFEDTLKYAESTSCPQTCFLGVFEDGVKLLKMRTLSDLRTRGLYIGNRDKSPSSRILIYSDTLNRLR